MSLRINLIQKLIGFNEKLIFYPRLSRYYRNILPERPVIVDVGSNKGQSIEFFQKLRKEAQIYAFEPNPRLFGKLEATFRESHLVSLFNAGISNVNGKLLFNETVTDETSTFEELNYQSDYLKMKARVLGVEPEAVISSQYMVEVRTLSDFISETGLKCIDVLKIDTEGHELKCLEGLFPLLGVEVKLIQIEHHFDDMYKNAASGHDIKGFLRDNNFGLHQQIKHGFGDFEEWIFKPA